MKSEKIQLTKKNLLEKIAELPQRSAWDRGINTTAAAIVSQVEDEEKFLTVKTFDDLREILLRGAADWSQYGRGACGDIVSEYDICNRFCTPAQAEKFDHGNKPPHGLPDWMSVYVRCLAWAESRIHGIFICYFFRFDR